MKKILTVAVLVLVLSVSSTWGTAFKDDFNRPDGDIGNGWSTQTDGTIEVKIVDNEVLIAGEQGTDWVRAGLSRSVTNETRISVDFKADDALNFHIRLDDAETGAFFEPYWWPGGPCQYAASEDGSWPGWTALAGSEMIAGEYNTLVIEQEGSMFTMTLNGEVIGSIANNGLTSIGSILIASDAAAGTTGSLHIDNVEIGTVVAGMALDPSPVQGAADVPRDVELAWTAGESAATHDVYFGTVLEDVTGASRDNPMGVLVSQGQSAATYDPDGLLDFETTYYWRVDEVNSAPDNTIFPGGVWSFTTEPFAYAIANIVATSNAVSGATEGPENTINGSGLNANDGHSIESSDMWLGVPAGDDPIYLLYEFGQVYQLHEMLVWNYNVQFELVLGFGLKDVTVEYSENGTDWTVWGDVELAQGTAQADYAANTTIEFAGVAAKFVRLTVNSGYGLIGQFGLSEVRFMSIPANAREPEPADGAADVSVDTMLTWRAGRDAISHEVSLGTDPNALALVGSVDTPSLAPGALDLGTTYYWGVDAVQEAKTWEGGIWSFSTQAYLVVEDFEIYDDEDNRIYQTWIDGYGVNNNGSTVGHLESPFAERTIVNSGNQSMPLFYDNTGTAMSEAEFALTQNWTTNGVKSLAIAFAGAAGNSGQLYVKINGTKVLYDGDAGDIARTTWQPWNIDLSTIGGSVSSVTSLIVGVEGAGATGVVYIDDIRLYPNAPEFITPVEPDAANLVASYAFDGNANDSSGNGHNGVIVGDITFENDPARGQVVSLPGGDDQEIQIEGVGISGTMPRTIACWAKADNTSIPDWSLIFGFTGDAAGEGGNGSHFNIGSLGGPGGVGAHVWGWEETIFSDEEALEWHHYAMSYDGTTIRYYGDGAPMDTDLGKSNDFDLTPSSDRVYFGGRITHTNSFPGNVDDAVIYSVTLTDEEVAYLAGRRAPMHKAF